jgi:hypothetical protein
MLYQRIFFRHVVSVLEHLLAQIGGVVTVLIDALPPAIAIFDTIFSLAEPGRCRLHCGSPVCEAAGMVGTLVLEA